MLITLRSKGASWIVKGLFVILIASFALWGVPDIYRNFQSAPVAATVGSTHITADELRRSVDFYVKQLQRRGGKQLDPELLRQLGVVDRALEGMIEPALLEAYATRLGMAVPDDMLQKAIKSDPRFRDQTGNFNPDAMEMYLRDRGWTQADLAADTRRTVLSYQFLRAMGAGVQAPRSMTETLYAYRAEQRIANTLAIPDSSITDVPTPDDAAIEKFYKDNPDHYQAPEYRALTLVRLDPEDYAKKYSITDDAVQKEYDSRQAELQIPEKRKIVQVVFPDEAAAKDLVDKIRQGTPFADAAKAANAGDVIEVGTLAESDLQQQLATVFFDAEAGRKAAEALFAADVGEVIDPVKGAIGWHVLSVSGTEPARAQPLDDDLRAKLRHAMSLRQAIDELRDVANELDDEMGSGSGLAEAAGKLGLPVAKIAAVDGTGKDAAGKEVTDVTRDQGQALKLAFQTGEGDDSLLTDTPNGGYIVLHVDSVQAAATRPLETVRDKVIADWQEVERKKAADAKAQAVADRIGKGESVGTIARDLGVPVLVSQPLTRDGDDPQANIGGALTAKLFAAKVGDAVVERAPADNAAVVAVLTQVKPADIASSGADVDKLQDDIGRYMGTDLYEQLSADIKPKIGVSVHQDVIDSIYK
ncbi:MAG TPA: SurA N-terminal domain-containing protein [Candidatus Acidoferrum sp.]|nr:SurA N-terminal domain-containing protein [Candidatus Acidoferrum sp.]